MKAVYDNVFYKKKFHPVLDEVTNITYWIILMTLNICKWLTAIILLPTYPFKYILSIWALSRFCLIGIPNIITFRKKFRNIVIIMFMSLISK
jgi:hypothetical protein